MKLLLVFLAVLVLVSAAKKSKGGKGGKPAKSDDGDDDGHEFTEIVEFCSDITTGKLTVNDTYLEIAFEHVNVTCMDLMDFLKHSGEDVQDVPDTNVSFNKLSNICSIIYHHQNSF